MSHISARYQWIKSAVVTISLVLLATGITVITPWHEPPTESIPSAPILYIAPAAPTINIDLPIPLNRQAPRSPDPKEGSHTGPRLSDKTYRVQPGDTLGRIASAWHTTVARLSAVNGISNPNRIFPGMLLKRQGKVSTMHRSAPTVHSGSALKAPSGSVGRVIAFAEAQLGDPYVWGAAGPNAWDCSGLTMKAYAAVGISLPHSSRAQYTFGHPVSRSALRPGDLLFYGYSASSIHHVALYIGNGMVLHASTSGQPVKVVPIGRTGSDYFGARRLL